MKLYDTPPARAGIRALLHFARRYRDIKRAQPAPSPTTIPSEAIMPSYALPYQRMDDIDQACTGLLDAAVFTHEDSVPILHPIAHAPLRPDQAVQCEFRYTLTVPQWFGFPSQSEQRRQIWWQSQSERFMADLLAHGEEFLRQYAEAIDASFP